MTIIGTWNLENLFRPGGPFGPKDDATYEAKLAALAATITSSAPDVLGVQEVGDPDALDDLVKLLPGEWHRHLSENFEDGHPIRVGFLSRLPLTVLADISIFPAMLGPVQVDDAGTLQTGMGRGALAVRVEPAPGEQLVMVACHLKSKLLGFPPGPNGRPRFTPHDEGERARYAGYAMFRRAAEAVTVRGLADDLLDGQGRTRSVAVVGDFNDEPQAATTQILLGPPGSEIGTAGAGIPDHGDAHRLWNLAPLIPEAERFSRVYHGRSELIDHILVSQALLKRVRQVHVIGAGALPSVTDLPAARRADLGSDHSPVLAGVSFTEAG
jgi:endonuclease/exonuclease/phosphatase family metal-dependent hydrolase